MNLSNLQLTDDNLGAIIQRLNALPRSVDTQPQTAVPTRTSQDFYQSATPIQGESYLISQGCYGLSKNQPIGTQHVGDCIAIILRNPQNNLTSLVHFDVCTTPQSLDNVFAPFKEQPVEASIIGAKYALHQNHEHDVDTQKYLKETSRANLLNVLGVLAANNVNLTSAWVADHNQPDAFIVDPKSGQIAEGIPSLPDPEQNILFATRYFSSRPQHIALTYDLTQSPGRFAMPLDTETIDFFNRFEEASNTKTKEGLDEWMVANGRRPESLEFFTAMLNHYQTSQIATSAALNTGIVQAVTISATSPTLH